ncbi:MAG: hypothetical protein J5647_05325 [Spirochaetaceae bacterium]|nr:hypothetical protein [Spirochaetaceae bacterium]
MIMSSKVEGSSLHPRNEYGHFTEKGVMELNETERQVLLDYLENEKYIDYKGIHISERKIDSVRKGKYNNEVKACMVLVKHGFEVFLLDEQYTRSDKADIFFKKDDERDFMELKETEDKITTQYNRSISQSPNCLISIKGYFSKIQKKNLIDAVNRNKNAKKVYVYLEKEKRFLKIK